VPNDLTAMAESNGPARRAASATSVAADASGRLASFHLLASGSAFSTNVFAARVLSYGVAGAIGPSPAGPGDSWRARREAFEDGWQHGRRFVYGALNAGGMGAEDFGTFCLVVGDPQASAPVALAVFPGDSAQRYTTGAVTVDHARAESEATAWADRADLAVTERGAEVLARPQDQWPEVLCGPGRYLEVVRAGHLPVSMVSEVRTRFSYRERLDELDARRELESEILSPDQANELDAYDVVQGWCRSLGVTVTDVPDQETLDGEHHAAGNGTLW